MSSGWAINWRWKDDDVKLVLGAIEDTPRPVVHVCSGSSGIGDVRIDAKYVYINPATSHKRFVTEYTSSPSVIGDMFRLPVRSGAAGTVVCDPPYIDEAQDGGLITELVRILKPGGTLLFYAPWVPRHRLIDVVSITAMVINKKSGVYKLFTTYHKAQASLFDF